MKKLANQKKGLGETEASSAVEEKVVFQKKESVGGQHVKKEKKFVAFKKRSNKGVSSDLNRNSEKEELQGSLGQSVIEVSSSQINQDLTNVEFLNSARETEAYDSVLKAQDSITSVEKNVPTNSVSGSGDSNNYSQRDEKSSLQIKRRELSPDRKKNFRYNPGYNNYNKLNNSNANGSGVDDFVQDRPAEVNLELPPEERVLEVRVLNNMNVDQLIDYGNKLGILDIAYLQRQEIIFKILDTKARKGVEIIGEGVLEKLQEGYGFLRSADFNYLPGHGDIYVAPVYIKKFGLRTGDQIKGSLRKPKEGERYFGMARIISINDIPANQPTRKTIFENLTPVFPDKKFEVESSYSVKSIRAMDLFAPIGFGQRGLIVAPPKTGKTVLLKELANSIIKNNPGIHMIVLLIDERPEEVTDFRRSVDAEVISSTFDENPARHIQVTEMVLEKAKRMVECGKHVVIILDSLTRLARAYNTMTPPSGKVLSGGIDANALSRPKRFFGAARNIENFGSLTIIASVLIETGSKMDDVIYEEFKGTGNMEAHLTRKLSNKRTYPAFDVQISGTRRDDLLVSEGTLNNMWILQRFLSNMNTVEAMEFLIEKVNKTESNKEFWEMMASSKVKS